jgi:type VI secretion system protein ImpG
MDPKLLEYYSRELAYMRQMSSEFADAYPGIAGRLGMQGMDVADPYVERLIEAFCLMTARTQLKLDAEFPKFTQRLLEIVYPNYVAPVPSMSVVQLSPETTQNFARNGFLVPRHTAFRTTIPDGEQTPCEFRSSRGVRLWPMALTSATLTDVPQQLPREISACHPARKLASALVLTLETTVDGGFAAMQNLDRLPVYISGEPSVASRLFELIHAAHVCSIVNTPGCQPDQASVIVHDAIQHDGLAPDDGLLPRQWNTFHGHHLLQEYVACPSVFYFFALTGLSAGLRGIKGHQVQVTVLLDRFVPELVKHVDAKLFQLFCTPVINLFPKRADPIALRHALPEYHVVPDRTRPLDYEVYAVSRTCGHLPASDEALAFMPMYQGIRDDTGHHKRYFSVRRQTRLVSMGKRRYGTRSAYAGTEVFLTLVDQQHAPYHEEMHYLSVDTQVTNRDLPCLLRHEDKELTMSDAAPVTRIQFVHQPSLPGMPIAQGNTAWQLIRQLTMNYLPLHDMPPDEGGAAIRELLRLFAQPHDSAQHAQIDSLLTASARPVVRRLPEQGLLVYGRGVACQLTVDETGFGGSSPYLFGVIMAQYLARHVAINTFAQTELHSLQRGMIFDWQPVMGKRGIV